MNEKLINIDDINSQPQHEINQQIT